MKKILIIVLIILIILFLILFDRYFLNKDIGNSQLSNVQICQNAGGYWRMFSDGCGDSCVKQRQSPDNLVGCTLAFQENCDCGPFRCWDSENKKCDWN